MRRMAEIRSVCVYCGSSAGDDPDFIVEARKLGTAIARAGIRLVYGGGGIGLMGAVAHAAMEAGGRVTGIIPEFLVAREHAFEGARELIVTHDMHERKRLLFENADAFVALPGGIGTLEELVEQLSWLQLDRHRKPVLLVNLKGFWNPFITLIEHQKARGFIPEDSFHFLVADRSEQAVPMLREALRVIPDAELHGPAAKAVAGEM
jgi:uncharacterized protein (TIGR00730 family)